MCFLVEVKRVDTKELLSDELKWVKFCSIAWTHDNNGFFYQVNNLYFIILFISSMCVCVCLCLCDCVCVSLCVSV